MGGMMELRHRAILANDHAIVAPGYKKVEYIQSTLNAHIQTDYIPVQYDEIYTEFQYEYSSGYHALFSAGTDTYQFVTLGYGGKTQRNFFVRYFETDAGDMNSVIPPSSWSYFSVDGDGRYESNGIVTLRSYEDALDGDNITLWIFRRRNDTSPWIGKIKSFRITNNGTLKMNLVPCVRILDNIAGMYDTVSKTFYSSPSGYESFTPGRSHV